MSSFRTTRTVVQAAFVLLVLVGVFLVRGHAERWCPLGGVEALYGYVSEGNLICSLGVSNFYILAAVLLSALLLRRAFCGYACPIGALGEWTRRLGRRLGVKPRGVPYAVDRTLALLKYAVLAVILYFTWRAGELVFRGYDPCYALISRHGEDITFWAYVISGAILAASIVWQVPFCRWLCPLAAVLNPFSRFGLTRVRRDAAHCVDCGLCERSCPMGIRFDEQRDITAARCMACLECVSKCPKQADQALVWGPPRRLGGGWSQGVLIGLLAFCLAGGVAASYAFPLPSYVKTRGAAPAEAAVVELEMNNLGCRGNASLLTYFFERDDELEIPGYLRIEAWPGPDPARVRVTYDPALTDADAVREAVTAPYFDLMTNDFRVSPFEIVERND